MMSKTMSGASKKSKIKEAAASIDPLVWGSDEMKSALLELEKIETELDRRRRDSLLRP
jgi:hypothetical protein